jgi:hypothetical protein
MVVVPDLISRGTVVANTGAAALRTINTTTRTDASRMTDLLI